MISPILIFTRDAVPGRLRLSGKVVGNAYRPASTAAVVLAILPWPVVMVV